MTRPSTGEGSRRYERYADAGLDVVGKERKSKVGVNDGNRGYSDSDGPAEKAERAEVARKAAIAGIHGHDLTDDEVKDEERARYYGGQNNGTPKGHSGFSKADQKRLKDAARADAKVHDE